MLYFLSEDLSKNLKFNILDIENKKIITVDNQISPMQDLLATARFHRDLQALTPAIIVNPPFSKAQEK